MLARFLLLSCLFVGSLPTTAPARALAAITVLDNLDGAGPPTWEDDDPTDWDDAFGDVDSDADDDCLPSLRFTLGQPCAVVRIFVATPSLPPSIAPDPLFRPPRHAAV